MSTVKRHVMGQAALGTAVRIGTKQGLQGQQGLDVFGGELCERERADPLQESGEAGRAPGRAGTLRLDICSLLLSHVLCSGYASVGLRSLKHKVGQFVRSMVLSPGFILGSPEELLKKY